MSEQLSSYQFQCFMRCNDCFHLTYCTNVDNEKVRGRKKGQFGRLEEKKGNEKDIFKEGEKKKCEKQ